MRQIKGVQGRYKAGTSGARQIQGCKVGTRQVEGVQGRYKGCEAGMRQVKGM